MNMRTINIRLKVYYAALIAVAFIALIFIIGAKYQATSDRASDALSEAHEYKELSDSLSDLHCRDVALLTELLEHNARIEHSLELIEANYEARRLRIVNLHADSVLVEFERLRSRLDSIVNR